MAQDYPGFEDFLGLFCDYKKAQGEDIYPYKVRDCIEDMVSINLSSHHPLLDRLRSSWNPSLSISDWVGQFASQYNLISLGILLNWPECVQVIRFAAINAIKEDEAEAKQEGVRKSKKIGYFEAQSIKENTLDDTTSSTFSRPVNLKQHSDSTVTIDLKKQTGVLTLIYDCMEELKSLLNVDTIKCENQSNGDQVVMTGPTDNINEAKEQLTKLVNVYEELSDLPSSAHISIRSVRSPQQLSEGSRAEMEMIGRFCGISITWSPLQVRIESRNRKRMEVAVGMIRELWNIPGPPPKDRTKEKTCKNKLLMVDSKICSRSSASSSTDSNSNNNHSIVYTKRIKISDEEELGDSELMDTKGNANVLTLLLSVFQEDVTKLLLLSNSGAISLDSFMRVYYSKLSSSAREFHRIAKTQSMTSHELALLCLQKLPDKFEVTEDDNGLQFMRLRQRTRVQRGLEVRRCEDPWPGQVGTLSKGREKNGNRKIILHDRKSTHRSIKTRSTQRDQIEEMRHWSKSKQKRVLVKVLKEVTKVEVPTNVEIWEEESD